MSRQQIYPEAINVSGLTHTDLREIGLAPGPAAAYRLRVYGGMTDQPRIYEALIAGDRVGVACGGDATWGDARWDGNEIDWAQVADDDGDPIFGMNAIVAERAEEAA